MCICLRVSVHSCVHTCMCAPVRVLAGGVGGGGESGDEDWVCRGRRQRGRMLRTWPLISVGPVARREASHPECGAGGLSKGTPVIEESSVPAPKDSRVALLPSLIVIAWHKPSFSTFTFSIETSTPSYASPSRLQAVPSCPVLISTVPTALPCDITS